MGFGTPRISRYYSYCTDTTDAAASSSHYTIQYLSPRMLAVLFSLVSLAGNNTRKEHTGNEIRTRTVGRIGMRRYFLIPPYLVSFRFTTTFCKLACFGLNQEVPQEPPLEAVYVPQLYPLQRLLQWGNGEKTGKRERKRGEIKSQGHVGDDGKAPSPARFHFPPPKLPRGLFFPSSHSPLTHRGTSHPMCFKF